MKKISLLLIVAFLILVSCNKGKDFQTFEDNRWYKNKPQTFEISIEESQNSILEFNFSHVYGANFPLIPVTITIENELGEKQNQIITLNPLESNGKPMGDCSGDICDFIQEILLKDNLKSGNYKVSISHQLPEEYIPNVIGIGVEYKVK